MQPQDEAQLPLEAVAATEPAAIEAPTYTPEYVAQLEAAANQLYADNQRYSKYADRIKRFDEDPEFDSFFGQSSTFFEDGKKRAQQAQEAEAPPWAKQLQSGIDEFRTDRSRAIAAKEAAEQASLNQFYSEQRQYGARLKAEHNLSDGDIVELSAIADTLAKQREKRVGLEEAFRSVTRFSQGTLRTPPPVLRQSDGVGGVPAPSPVNVRENMKTRDGVRATISHYLGQNAQK